MRTGTAVAEEIRNENAQPENVLARRVASYVAQNPLRKWRTEKRQTMQMVCSLLGVSISAFQSWESGASFPSADSMESLIQLTGNPNLETEWKVWYAARPKLSAEDRDERYDAE